MERLKNLLLSADENRGKWLIGNKPVHYKRLSVEFKEADRLAEIGAIKIGAAFGTRLYYSQSVIAGAILSGDYDSLYIVAPSQMGKSFLMGRVALYLAYQGHQVSVAAAAKDKRNDPERHAKRVDLIINNWDKILQIIDEELPSFDRIMEIMTVSGMSPSAAKAVMQLPAANSVTNNHAAIFFIILSPFL